MRFTQLYRRCMLAAAALGVAAPHAAAQAPSTAAALKAAQRDFAHFAAHQTKRKGGSLADFPLQLTELAELKNAKVGYGFAVHTIEPADLLAGRSTMRAMARPMNQWRFVISANGRAVGLATVEKIDGRYETVSYGGAVLAKDLDAAARQHGNADKSNLRLLRIYQARSDFLAVDSEDGRARYAPLHSARESLMLQPGVSMMGKPASRLLDETELLQPLRTIVQQTMAAPL